MSVPSKVMRPRSARRGAGSRDRASTSRSRILRPGRASLPGRSSARRRRRPSRRRRGGQQDAARDREPHPDVVHLHERAGRRPGHADALTRDCCHSSARRDRSRRRRARLHRLENGQFGGATLLSVAAPRRKRAGRRRAEHVAGLTRDRLECLNPTDIEAGDALEQSQRVRMPGRAKIASAAPVSTNVPAYMTFTRSHIPATTPRSW